VGQKKAKAGQNSNSFDFHKTLKNLPQEHMKVNVNFMTVWFRLFQVQATECFISSMSEGALYTNTGTYFVNYFYSDNLIY
jgi:hypothetical protein